MKIFDAHAHSGKWPFAGYRDDNEFSMQALQKFNIEKCIISSAEAIVYDMVAGNAQMASFAAAHDQLLGYVVLNPNYLELSRAELAKYSDRKEIVGVKLHPFYSQSPFNSDDCRKLIRTIADHNMPILVHTHDLPWSSPAQVGAVAGEFPDQIIIMGHGGLTNFADGIAVTAEHDNIFLEICGSPVPSGKIDKAVQQLGSEKILYGSDITLLSPAFALGTVLDAAISESQKEDILYNNAYKLFQS